MMNKNPNDDGIYHALLNQHFRLKIKTVRKTSAITIK